ncbi:hypothetical protein BDY24DRAFT_403696 [Mrakia frigida]|uniref:uncharacterized protein n=1 Tax=Mrakia frigida TaxID=29902 RepID=UPI003FCBF003
MRSSGGTSASHFFSFDSASIVLGRSPPTITMPGTDNFNGTLGANGGFVTTGPMGGEMKILYVLREKLDTHDSVLKAFSYVNTPQFSMYSLSILDKYVKAKMGRKDATPDSVGRKLDLVQKDVSLINPLDFSSSFRDVRYANRLPPSILFPLDAESTVSPSSLDQNTSWHQETNVPVKILHEKGYGGV